MSAEEFRVVVKSQNENFKSAIRSPKSALRSPQSEI